MGSPLSLGLSPATGKAGNRFGTGVAFPADSMSVTTPLATLQTSARATAQPGQFVAVPYTFERNELCSASYRLTISVSPASNNKCLGGSNR